MALRGEAEGFKRQLAALPAIATEQVRQLRQAEQALAQTEARCQTMAASLEVLQKARRALSPHGRGEPAGGSGGGYATQPRGGDQALLQAQAEQLRCRERLRSLKAELGVATSDAAETIERQRRDLDAELTTLRKAAATIPWAGLQERITAPWPGRPTWPLILRLPICCSWIVPAWSGHCRTCTAPVPA